VAGIRFQPIHPLSFLLEGEVGSADRPFYPVSEKNYHALGARAQYKTKTLTLAAGYRENYNNNSISITAFSSRSRNYSADASWAARPWFTVDAGYSRLHLDTLSGLYFFAGPQPVNSTSLYISNIHAANLGVRLSIGRRADLYAGYSITRDTGDGRSSPVAAGADPVSALLAPCKRFHSAFSLRSPVSVRLKQSALERGLAALSLPGRFPGCSP
jgi:predicted porin